MALLEVGSFDDLSVGAVDVADEALRSLSERVTDLGEATQLTRALQDEKPALPVSDTPRGLSLKSIRLLKGFESWIGSLFSATNEVYFVSYAHDLSGEPPTVHPPSHDAQSGFIELKAGDLREFIGSGVGLFPLRQVVSGISVRIHIWESDRASRDAGKTIGSVAETIKDSELNQLLKLIALAGGPTAAQLGLIKDASVELAGLVGKVLESNSDDYVDFFEGTFPVNKPWSPEEETCTGSGAEIVVGRL